MKVDNDGISLAVLDLVCVVGGDVEGELEACGVGAVMEGGGGVVMDEGGCWGRWLRECVQPEADAGEESPDVCLDSEKGS